MLKVDKSKLVAFLIGGGITLVFAFFSLFGVMKTLEYKTQDFRFQIRGERRGSDKVRIICMGDESVTDKAMGRWPWKRRYHAIILNIFSKYKPAEVMYDVLFTEKSDYEEDDRILADQLKKLKVYFPMFCIIDEGEAQKIENPFQRMLLSRIAIPGEVNDSLYNAVELVLPVARFALGLAGSGYANAVPDADGTTRRAPLLIQYDGKMYPHIAFLMAMHYIGAEWENVEIKLGKYINIKKSKVGSFKIPVDKHNQMLLNYPGGLNSYNPMSFLEIIDSYRTDRSDEKLVSLKDKVIFVGLTATGTVDLRPTPFAPLFPMVGVVAAIFSNIVDKNFLVPSSGFLNFLMVLFTGFLITGLSPKFRPLTGAFLSAVTIVIWCGISYILFLNRVIIPVFYPVSAGLFSFLGMTVYRFATEEKEKKFIKNTFQRYVSSSVVDELIKNPAMLALGGQKKYLTVFFSDIRGFTSMSEKMAPEEVVKILNEYLTEMTDIIFKYNGTLDKFIGDAVMAFWGAPKYFPNHAELAVRAAVEMQKKVCDLCRMWEGQGRRGIGIGMGVNTGDVVIGNMGSATFADYTVIGDNVNTAQRLEANAPAGKIIISESTFSEVKDIVKTKKLAPLMVKGKEKPVQVYEVQGIL